MAYLWETNAITITFGKEDLSTGWADDVVFRELADGKVEMYLLVTSSSTKFLSKYLNTGISAFLTISHAGEKIFEESYKVVSREWEISRKVPIVKFTFEKSSHLLVSTCLSGEYSYSKQPKKGLWGLIEKHAGSGILMDIMKEWEEQ